MTKIRAGRRESAVPTRRLPNFFRVPTLDHRRACGTGQSLDVKTLQYSDHQTHGYSNALTGRGFGFTDDHDRVPVEWFRYPEDESDGFTEGGITDMPLVTKGGMLREKRSNGAVINRTACRWRGQTPQTRRDVRRRIAEGQKRRWAA